MSVSRTPPKTGTKLTSPSQFGSDPALYTSESGQHTDSKIVKRTKRRFNDPANTDDITLSDLLSRMDEIKNQQDSKFNSLESSLKELTHQNTDIKESMILLSEKYDDVLLEIRNIPVNNTEKKENLIEITKKIGTVINVPISDSDIRDIYRINQKGKPTGPIIVNFTSTLKCEKVIGATGIYNKANRDKRLSTTDVNIPGPAKPIYVAESLTASVRRLHYQTRLFAKNHNFAHCWTSFDLQTEFDNLNIAETAICDAASCVSHLPDSRQCLKIFQQNIRSLKCNLPGLLPILASTGVDWDCIVLTECWLPSTPFLPSLDGYNSYASSNNLTQNEGVVLYYKNSLNISVEELIIEDANCLAIFLNKDTVALALYRPPGYKNIDNFLKSINLALTKYSSKQNIIFLGDININIADQSTDNKSPAYLDMMAFHGTMPAYTLSTHSKTCLDHTFLKTKLTARCLILETTLTDHNSVALFIASLPNLKPARTIKHIDYNFLNEELTNSDFNPLYAISDANKAACFLNKTISNAIQASIKEHLQTEFDNLNIAETAICDAASCVSHLPDSRQCLKIFQQNIRSLKCNLPGLLPILASTGVDWDCIVLTECWLPSTPFLPSLDGYNSYASSNNLTQNEGVVLYYKNSLNISVEELIIEDANCLAIFLNKDTVALALYRPPGYKNIDNFLKSINLALTKYSSKQNIIFLGDININIADQSTDNKSPAYLDMMAFHGTMPAYTLSTHSKTCLDHTFLKTKLTARCLILETTLTDHNSVALFIASLPNLKPARTIKHIDYNFLNEELTNSDFNPLYAISDANKAACFLNKTISNAIQASIKEPENPLGSPELSGTGFACKDQRLSSVFALTNLILK
ncbi:hypothetical protein ACJJTC_013074, partial [Scirpophaga incertulas]